MPSLIIEGCFQVHLLTGKASPNALNLSVFEQTGHHTPSLEPITVQNRFGQSLATGTVCHGGRVIVM